MAVAGTYRLAMGVVVIWAGLVPPTFAQTAGASLVACGQFTAAHCFGETEFEFKYNNFQRCLELTPPGLTLVEAAETSQGQDADKGTTYTVTCQCTQALCASGSCKE